MLKDRQSKLVHYGIGIVVEDKPRKSDIVKITNIEEFPYTDGKLIDNKEELKHELPDKKGVPRKSSATRDMVIEAIWLGGYDSNRITAPDVIKNETVDIYRYADTQEYYWRKRGREPGIRRLETVCYMYGNLQAPLKEWDKRSSYWQEFSTHDKHIVTQTTKSDGEKFSYSMQISPKKNQVYMGDDIGNYIRLLSSEILVDSENTQGTFHQLYKTNYIFGSEDMILGKTRDFVMECIDAYFSNNVHILGTLHVSAIEANIVKSNLFVGPIVPGSAAPDLTLPGLPDKYPKAVPTDEFHDLEPPK